MERYRSRRIILISIFVWVIAPFASAQEREEIPPPKHLFEVSRLTLFSSAALDLSTTYAFDGRGIQEGNRMVGQNRIQQGLVVAGTTFAGDWASRALFRAGHPKIATALNFILAGAHSSAAAWNLKVVNTVQTFSSYRAPTLSAR